MTDPKRELLRHALATVAYRGAKTLRDAPEGFATFKSGSSTRTPGEILAHMGDLFDWALSISRGAETWRNQTTRPWPEEVERFFRALTAFDEYLASDKPMALPVEQLFQGPVADALTHVGQLAMLRGMAGVPIKGENYFKAEIATGRTGFEQAAPRREF